MNRGKFFSLDLEASCLNEGIAVFDYTDIYDASVEEGNSKTTPRFPIFVSITPDAVKFILQYCVYLQNADKKKEEQRFVTSLTSANSNDFQVRHMEEVLIELPLTATNGLSLASTLKRLYHSPFPIVLRGEDGEEAEKNYILELIKERYDNPTALDQNLNNIHYSNLPIYEIFNEKRKKYELCDENKRYNKVLRKLTLDFLFDMMHSDVFKNSMHYDTMYERMMSDYFCSALIHKAEFYYHRALVNSVPRGTTAIKIYAEKFDIAEKHWVECIQSPLSDKHFEFQPKWYDVESNMEDGKDAESNMDSFRKIWNWLSNNFRKIWSWFCDRFKSVLSILSPLYYFYLVDYWFAPPEEELRRVYYREQRRKIACSRHLFQKKFYNLKGREHIRMRSIVSSKWLIKRYCFKDAYRMSFFWSTNTILISIMVFFISYVLEFPCISKVLPILESAYVRLEQWAICNPILYWVLGVAILLFIIYKFSGKIFLLYPRLIAAITAAWFSITLGDNMFKAFFDQPWSKFSVVVLLLFIALFVYYEVNKIVPKLSWFSKVSRTLELMIISFTISLVVGICTINFTGEKMLEKSGVLPNFYRDNVILTSNVQDDEPALILDFDDILASDKWSDSLVMNTYTHSIPGNIDAAQSRYAVHEFANTPYGEDYMNRIVHAYSMLDDSARVHDSTLVLSDSIRGRFLLRHENNALFMDLLPYVKHADGKPVAEYVATPKWMKWIGDSIFILHDFLIQFAVIAMFIGIFIQMIFEEKNVTEA